MMMAPFQPRRILALLLVEVLLFNPLIASIATAGPEGATVVHGDVSIRADGTSTIIHASDGSIIDYTNFDIAVDESVRFIQPDSASSVLNRIRSTLPTQIDGMLAGNGNVYIINPLGIYFGDGAFIDVHRLVVAAGNITNDDFLAGIDRFTLTGAVENFGEIQAQEAVLIGNYVLNRGVIRGESVVVLAAGDEILLTEPGERGFVRIDRSVVESEVYGVVNTGTIDGGEGKVVMAAGDLYSLALFNEGTVRGGTIVAQGGAESRVTIRGELDAAGRGENGDGGSVAVLGGEIDLDGASIDASGASGGEVLIGGDFQGQGDVQTAKVTFVDGETTIRADADVDGDGGKVIVWADDRTGFLGEISAKGGSASGDGGFVEVSGKEALAFDGHVDTSAPNGQMGTLLLDPKDVTIDNVGASALADIDAFTDSPTGLLAINAATINGAATNVEIRANNNILQDATGTINIAASGVGISMQAGQSVTLNSTITTNDGAVTIVANETVANGVIDLQRDPGTAVITMAGGTTIDAGSAAIDITLSTGPTTNNASGDISLETLLTTGAVTVTNTNGSINVGSATAGTTATFVAGGAIEEFGADVGADITAPTIDLAAATGIGAAATLELAATTLTAATTAGNIDLANINAAATAVTSLTTGIGTIDFAQSGGGDVVFATVTTTNGDIDLSSASGALTATSVTAGTGAAADGDITLTTTGSGSVNVDDVTAGGDQITITSIATIAEAGADADADLTAATLDLDAAVGIGPLARIETAATSIEATSALGDISIGNDNAALTTVSLVSTGAGAIVLDQSGGGAIVVTSATTTDGNITLTNTGADLTAASVSAGSVAAADGNVTLATAGGSGTVNVGDVSAGGDQISVISVAGIAESGADAGADLTAAVLDLDAVTGIGAGGAIETAATTIAADTTNGDIALTNTNVAATTVTSLTTGTGTIDFDQTGGGDVAITATTTDGNIDLANAGGSLTATTVTAGAAGDVTLTTTTATTSGSVNVGSVTAADDQITITSVAAIEEAGVDAAADLSADVLDLTGATGIGAAGAIETAATTVTAGTTNGNIDLANANAAATTVTSLSTGTGTIGFAQTGGGDVAFTTATTGAGDITLSADSANLSATTVTAGTAAAADGNVSLTTTTSGNVFFDTISALADAITVASAGLINEIAPGEATTDLTAASIDLDAENGIGTTGTIELAGTTIEADTTNGAIALLNANGATTTVTTLTTGTGAIGFDQTGGGDVVFTTATTTNGNIDLANAGGSLTANTVTAGTVAAADGDVVLTTTPALTSGSVNVGNVSAAGDQITVASATAIEESGADAGADLTAAVLDLDGATGIGAAETIETAATTIDADTTIGNIDLANAAAGLTTVQSLTTTAGTIDFAQSGGVDVVFQTVNTVSGDITLSNAAGNLTATTVTAGSGAAADGDVTLTTTTSGAILIDTITALADSITIAAAGLINEIAPGDGGADLLAGSIDLDAGTGIGTTGAIEIVSTAISADSANGNVDLANDTGTTATTVSSLTTGTGTIDFAQTGGGAVAFTTVSSANGDVTLSNVGADLTATTVTAGTVAAADGDVTLTTTGTGSVGVGDITAEGDQITVTSVAAIEESGTDAAADLTAAVLDLNGATGIGAAGAIETAATTIDADTSTGNIDLANANAAATTVASLTTGTGTIDFAQTGGGDAAFTTATTTDGAINLSNAGGSLTATTVTAGGTANVTLETTTAGTSGSVNVGDVTAADDQITITSVAAIEEAGADAGADLTASVLDLTGATGIGAGGSIETAATTLTAGTTNGNIDLANANALATTVTSLTTGTGTIGFAQTGGGEVTFGTVTTGAGDITLSNASADLTATTVTAGSGAAADGDVTLTTTTSGNVFFDTISALADAITVASAGLINEVAPGEATTDLTAGSIDLDAVNGIGTTGTIELAGTTIEADTTNGAIALLNANGATTTVTTLTTGTGAIDFDQSGGGDVIFTSATTTDGAIDLSNAGGSLTATTVAAGGTADVTLETTTAGTSGSVNVGDVTAADDQITVTSVAAIEEAGADGGADLTASVLDLNGATGIGAGGSIETASTTIDADTTNGDLGLANVHASATTVDSLSTGTGDMTFAQSGGGVVEFVSAVTGDGNATLSSDGSNLIATSVLAGGAGDVSLTTTTSGDVLVDAVTAIGDSILLTSVGGIEESGADAAADLAGDILFSSSTGIGAGGTIETASGSIDATTGTGDINLANDNGTSATNIGTLTTSTGAVDFDQTGGGQSTFTTVSTTNGQVVLTNTGGGIVLDGQIGTSGSASAEVASDVSVVFAQTVGTDPVTSVDGFFVKAPSQGAETVTFNESVTVDLDDYGGMFSVRDFGDSNVLLPTDESPIPKLFVRGDLEFTGTGTAEVGDVTARVVTFNEAGGDDLRIRFRRQFTVPGSDEGVDLIATDRIDITGTPSFDGIPGVATDDADAGNLLLAVGNLLDNLTTSQKRDILNLVNEQLTPDPGGTFLYRLRPDDPIDPGTLLPSGEIEIDPRLAVLPEGTISIPPIPTEVQLAAVIEKPPVATKAPLWESALAESLRCAIYEGESQEVIEAENCGEYVGEGAVEDPRLEYESFSEARDAYVGLFEELVDVQDSIQAATDAYLRVTPEEQISGPSFRRYVDTQGANLAARSYMKRLSDYTRSIDTAASEVQEGSGELMDQRSFFIDTIAPSGISVAQFEEAIAAGPDGSSMPDPDDDKSLFATDLPTRAPRVSSLIPVSAGGM